MHNAEIDDVMYDLRNITLEPLKNFRKSIHIPGKSYKLFHMKLIWILNGGEL